MTRLQAGKPPPSASLSFRTGRAKALENPFQNRPGSLEDSSLRRKRLMTELRLIGTPRLPKPAKREPPASTVALEAPPNLGLGTGLFAFSGAGARPPHGLSSTLSGWSGRTSVRSEGGGCGAFKALGLQSSWLAGWKDPAAALRHPFHLQAPRHGAGKELGVPWVAFRCSLP